MDISPHSSPGMPAGRIFLTGFMGSGKTYWGSRWAQQYGLPFIDLDAEIEREEGKTIATIFEERGEAYFRQQEAAWLRKRGGDHSFIMACGGGTPCFHNNMPWMNAQGITIYLQASAQRIYDRVVSEKDKRPLLKNTDAHSLQIFIEDKLAEREPFYRQASYVIPVNELHLESLSALDKQTRNA